MTRLKQEDISDISISLDRYSSELVQKTGCTLKEIAEHAVNRGTCRRFDQQLKVAVIPMTCGQGIIVGFAESVASIISYLGFNVVITANSDAGGVAEAIQNGTDILFMADDDRFVAINVRTSKVSDNGEATGIGYVAGLERMCAGLVGKHVLVIGAGPVGTSAAIALRRIGAKVSIYDIDSKASERLSGELLKLGNIVKIEMDLEGALDRHRILVDASPAEDIIKMCHISEDTMIAAPGIPLGVQSGLKLPNKCLLHDPLQIGVATMLFEVAFAAE